MIKETTFSDIGLLNNFVDGCCRISVLKGNDYGTLKTAATTTPNERIIFDRWWAGNNFIYMGSVAVVVQTVGMLNKCVLPVFNQLEKQARLKLTFEQCLLF